MPEIEIYTTPWCPYCLAAKKLLDEKGAAYTEIDVMMVPGKRQEMVERAGGRRTVPQIFVDGAHLGDSDEMMAMEAEGVLDARLGLTGENKG